MPIQNKTKILRVTTVPISLKLLLKGQHRYMTQNGLEVIGVASIGKELYEVQETEGIRVVALNMTRTIAPFKDLVSLWHMYQLCKKEKPTIVHSHTPKAGIIGMLGAKLAGVPIRLHTVAGLPLMETTGLKRILLNGVEKFTYVFATKVYPNSKGLYDFILANRFTTENKLKIIANGSSNGIDTTHFSPEKITEDECINFKVKLGVLPEDFVFVFVGRLVGDKGINELVIAYAQLKTPNSKLLLVGPLETGLDPLQPEILKEIESNPNIINVGFQSDVRPYFAISDCLVFPSYREGFPNVVMQAGAMGLPCIVSDINGCNEIIIEGENGVIIPVKNVEAIKVAMFKMRNDVQWCQKLKQNSRKLIQQRYEQQVVWKELLGEYNRLISQLEK
jgi:glycosyltransferase involved in cell wall biosynthesis